MSPYTPLAFVQFPYNYPPTVYRWCACVQQHCTCVCVCSARVCVLAAVAVCATAAVAAAATTAATTECCGSEGYCL
jgi:hypothetical protein